MRCWYTSSMCGQLAGLRLLPLRVPPLQLPLDVALLAAELAEARPRRGRRRGSSRARRRGLHPPGGARRRRARLARCSRREGRSRRRSPSRRRARRSRRRRRRSRAPARRARCVGPSAAMMRCSRPMSCAVASTWPSGGRRSTRRVPGRVGDLERQVRVAAGDQLVGERRRGSVDVGDEPRTDAFGVDALRSVDVHADTVVTSPPWRRRAARRRTCTRMSSYQPSISGQMLSTSHVAPASAYSARIELRRTRCATTSNPSSDRAPPMAADDAVARSRESAGRRSG